MAINITTPVANPNPISMPGSTTSTFGLTGTPGTQVSIEYLLSDSNNIVFVGEADPKKKAGGEKEIKETVTTVRKVLSFGGGQNMVSFFVTIRVTNVNSGVTRLAKLQIRVV